MVIGGVASWVTQGGDCEGGRTGRCVLKVGPRRVADAPDEGNLGKETLGEAPTSCLKQM